MHIEIYTPFGYNELGGRSNNEDSVYPNLSTANTSNTLFLVCDGVGGAEKGEIASELACKGFADYFNQNNIEYSDKDIIAKALDHAEEYLDEYLNANPSSKGMGTTVTLLHIHTEGITVAHIGDSRIYQVRNGEIIHQTKDHSLAMELFSSGIITLEQARQHPRRNEITRALQGKSVRHTKAEVAVIDDVKKDDYFFLCTDGVLEHVDENILEDTIKKYDDPETIVKELKEISYDRTKDNFSAYLIKIKEVIRDEKQEVPLLPMADSAPKPIGIAEPKSKKSNRKLIWALGTCLILAGIFLGYIGLKNYFPDLLGKAKPTKEVKKEQEQNPNIIKKNEMPSIPDDKKKWWFFYLAKKNGLLGIIRIVKKDSFNIRLPFEYQEIQEFKGVNKFHKIKKNNKYGFILPDNNALHLIIPQYEEIIKVDSNEKAIILDKNGKSREIDLRKELKKNGKNL